MTGKEEKNPHKITTHKIEKGSNLHG